MKIHCFWLITSKLTLPTSAYFLIWWVTYFDTWEASYAPLQAFHWDEFETYNFLRYVSIKEFIKMFKAAAFDIETICCLMKWHAFAILLVKKRWINETKTMLQ